MVYKRYQARNKVTGEYLNLRQSALTLECAKLNFPEIDVADYEIVEVQESDPLPWGELPEPPKVDKVADMLAWYEEKKAVLNTVISKEEAIGLEPK